MSIVNTKTVRRSAAILNYGENFVYQEYFAAKGFFQTFFTGLIFLVVIGLSYIAASIPFLKR